MTAMTGQALVVVDMQNVFADSGSPWATSGFAPAAVAVEKLLDGFERIAFTRFVAPKRPEGAWRDYYQVWPFALQPPEADLWHLVPALARRQQMAGHPVVDLPTFGKWGAQLRAAVGDAESLVLCGVSTDCCILSTALSAADAGLAVTVVAEACAGASPADHQRALDVMALYGPLITIR